MYTKANKKNKNSKIKNINKNVHKNIALNYSKIIPLILSQTRLPTFLFCECV